MFHSRLAYGSYLLVLVLLAASVRADTERDFNQKLTTVEIAALVAPSVVTITGELAYGSGVVLDSSGVIVTNHHVIEDQQYLSIALSNGDIYDDVRVLDVDVRRDLALLKIKAFNLSAAKLGDSDDIQVGEAVVLVGNPQGYDGTLSEGVISAIRKDPEGFRLIQTSAPISQGSSGGGMFNSSGELIGIAMSVVPDAQNLNFAVPINYARGLTFEGAGMTLVEFANQLSGASVGLGGESTVGSGSTAADDAEQEMLLVALRDSQFIWQNYGGFYSTTIPGSTDLGMRHEKEVWVALYGGGIVVFSSYSEELNIELTPALLHSLLELNYDLNLSKVSLDKDGDVVAHAEFPLDQLDGSALDLTAGLVAYAANQAKELVEVNLAPSGNEILSGELTSESSMDSSALVRLRNTALAGHAESQAELAHRYLYGDGVDEDPVEAARWYRSAADQGNTDAQFALGWMYATGVGVSEDADEAVRWYRLAADKGDATAQYNLGLAYREGRLLPEDAVEAVRWYRLSADQGYDPAQYNLGWLYANGVGVPEDASEAERWYRLAADQGNPRAQFNLGWMYTLGAGVPTNQMEALRWLRLAAEQGLAEGQRGLGVLYNTGFGVPEDADEAAHWFGLAADQGDAQAQTNLGDMYASGVGVPEDGGEAVRWYRLAADQGHATAQFNLGWMYNNGVGVPEDASEAERLYRLAADQGYAPAQYNLGSMYELGVRVPEDANEAMRWYRLAADQGHDSAQYNLGVIYATGLGVPEDADEAAHWFGLAADQGHAAAQYNIGWMYANGIGLSEDPAVAVQWYRLAADQRDAHGQFSLGWMYANGLGVPEDADEAVRWFGLAANQGLADAQHALGLAYANGIGVPQDTGEAVRWMRLAVEQGHTPAEDYLRRRDF